MQFGCDKLIIQCDKRGTSTPNLQWSGVAGQVEGFCTSYFATQVSDYVRTNQRRWRSLRLFCLTRIFSIWAHFRQGWDNAGDRIGTAWSSWYISSRKGGWRNVFRGKLYFSVVVHCKGIVTLLLVKYVLLTFAFASRVVLEQEGCWISVWTLVKAWHFWYAFFSFVVFGM